MTIAILTLVCMLTYSFEIVFGIAGTIMMLFIMSFLIPEKTLVIYSTLPQLLVAAIGLWRSPRTVEWRHLFNMLTFAALGTLFGYWMFRSFSDQVFHYVLSIAIIVFGAFLVISPAQLRIPGPVQRLLDFLAGISQQLFGISGPIAMTRIMGTFSDKTVIRNYALAFFLSLNLVRISSYIVDGSLDREIIDMMLQSGPFIFIALWYANHLHFRVNEKLFRKVVSWIILIGGFILLFNHP